MTRRTQKHMDESWVVKANRERDVQHQIKSRERRQELIREQNERFERLYHNSPWFDGAAP